MTRRFRNGRVVGLVGLMWLVPLAALAAEQSDDEATQIAAAQEAYQSGDYDAALAGLEPGDEIMTALQNVGLRGFEDVPCGTLSAGQQRRVNLARLYMVPARLWILDEPFTAIDKTGIAAIETLLANQVEKGGAVVVTTHQPLQSIGDVRRIELG